MKGTSKNDDCYFFYYSSCSKGDDCPFRHEASALGNETVCSYWQQGACSKVRCGFRHMELKKNRSMIACYWESQPGGCRKSHCPFSHSQVRQNLEDLNAGENASLLDQTQFDSKLSLGNGKTDLMERNDLNEASAVQSVVVNINEESDNESIPTPCKNFKTCDEAFRVKSLEELRLEQIQKQDAALYQYDLPAEENLKKMKARTDLRNRLQVGTNESKTESTEFKVKTIEEIRAAKLAKASCGNVTNSDTQSSTPSSNTKRTAPAPSGRQIRIKRAKTSSDNTLSRITSKEEKQVNNETPFESSKVTTEDSMNDFFNDDDDDDVVTNQTSMNEDELLLEIDNILGH